MLTTATQSLYYNLVPSLQSFAGKHICCNSVELWSIWVCFHLEGVVGLLISKSPWFSRVFLNFPVLARKRPWMSPTVLIIYSSSLFHIMIWEYREIRFTVEFEEDFICTEIPKVSWEGTGISQSYHNIRACSPLKWFVFIRPSYLIPLLFKERQNLGEMSLATEMHLQI